MRLPAVLLALASLALFAYVAPGAAPGGDDDQPWEEATRFPSNGGGYLVALRLVPDPLPENEPFDLSVWILDGEHPDAPLDDVKLDVDAGMPEHGHGMNRVPEVSRRDDGGFDVRGMLFHMGGTWELYLDVTRGPLTERAQRSVTLE